MLMLADISLPPNTVHAGISFLISAAVGVALLLVARYLYKPKVGKQSQQDQPTTLATKGEYTNYIIGTQKTGYLFALAWGARNRGVGSQDIPTWFESGWHAIGLGPAVTLWRIEENGLTLWEGPINSATTPSGSTIVIDGMTSFRIYWGEDNQPIDPEIGQYIPSGVQSQWPHLFHIVWNRKRLGGSKTWGQIEYVWTAGCAVSQLTESDYEQSSYPDQWPSGVNYAHVIYQILTAPYPWGVGMDSTLLDRLTLERLGVLVEDEEIYMNMLFDGGAEARRVLEAILLDTGVAMPQVGNFLLFLPQRPPGASESEYLPNLTDDFVSPPDIKRKVIHSETTVNVPVFTFNDQRGDKFEFRTNDVAYGDDASFSDVGSIRAERISIDTVSHGEHAVRIAQRREQETILNNSFKLKGLHGTRMMIPGQMFIRNNDRYRIASILPSFDSPDVDIEATLDLYGIDPITNRELTPPAAYVLPTVPDVAFTWLELDQAWTGLGHKQIIVPRIRNHEQIVGSNIVAYLGAGVTSFDLGEQATAVGGRLQSSVPSYTTGGVIDYGPVFLDFNGDCLDFPTVADDPVAWEQGYLLAIINEEIFYVKNLDLVEETQWTAETSYSLGEYVIPSGDAIPTGLVYECVQGGLSGETEPDWPRFPTRNGFILASQPTTVQDGQCLWKAYYPRYQVRGMIRARMGTIEQSHEDNDVIYLIRNDFLDRKSSTIFADGENICIKSLPYSESDSVEPGEVSSVCDDLSA